MFKLFFVTLVTAELASFVLVSSKSDKHQHNARSEDGCLFYDGEWYSRGQAICIDKKDEYPTRWGILKYQARIDYFAAHLWVIFLLSSVSNSAIITTINHDEVWFKRVDGSKSKLYISQLQKGKYTIKHAWSTWDLTSLICLIVPFYVQYIMI